MDKFWYSICFGCRLERYVDSKQMQTQIGTEVKIEIEEIEVQVELEKRWRCGESGVGSDTC